MQGPTRARRGLTIRSQKIKGIMKRIKEKKYEGMDESNTTVS
jgi:hypothetical protein